jgi:hypothetical protein
VEHEHDGMRLQIRTPGDLQTIELVARDRVPAGCHHHGTVGGKS